MKIQRITDSHRQDFRAIMECEHCGATCELTTGYNDNNYHSNVIPAMKCKNCGLSRNDPSAARPVEATMPEITQADREAAKELIHRKWYGFSVAAYEEVFCQAFAQHREAAEAAKVEATRAERERIRPLLIDCEHLISLYRDELDMIEEPSAWGGTEGTLKLLRDELKPVTPEALGVTAEVKS
jgi:hypothetical protein